MLKKYNNYWMQIDYTFIMALYQIEIGDFDKAKKVFSDLKNKIAILGRIVY